MSYLAQNRSEADYRMRGELPNIDDAGNVSRLLLDACSSLDRNEAEAIDLMRQASNLMSQSPLVGKTLSGGLALWQIKRLEAYIDQHMPQPILVHELASVVRLSTSYFSAAFKVSFRMSPHNYIIARRVAFAKACMRGSDIPLCEIALDCGLADQAHLSRVFRRVTGTTPSAWRRLHCDRASAREDDPLSSEDRHGRRFMRA